MKHAIIIHAATCSMALCLLSCAASYTSTFTEVAFKEGSIDRVIKLKLPEVIIKENHTKEDDGGFLREFIYQDGAVFYVAYDNAVLKKQVGLTSVPTHFLPNEKGFTASGADENGLFWKEVKINDLVIGYKGVSKSQAQQFDETIQHMKWK